MYAIVDIETTGGKYNEEGITEIAIYQFDGEQITDQFISLINPQQPIQDYVVKLTGINNQMLNNAPKFYEVGKRIIEITDNCVIVAHNASFDYRMLCLEFKRLGYEYQRDRICTVELSKQLIKDAKSYKLGNLSKELGIPISNRHRASGDAYATYQLFKLLLVKDQEKQILKNNISFYDTNAYKNRVLKYIEQAPTTFGIFYCINHLSEIIYIGRGNNIKQEITNFYVKTTKKALAIQKKIMQFTFETCGSELLTELIYKLEVEVLRPKYNVKSKPITNQTFINKPNCILVEQGRSMNEHAIVLIENKKVMGYGFTNLAYQEQALDRLKKILTPVQNIEIATRIVKSYLKKNRAATLKENVLVVSI